MVLVMTMDYGADAGAGADDDNGRPITIMFRMPPLKTNCIYV
jgi:hypothetical protein